MEDKAYSVHELAEMAGVSVRTLHHYDQIGLLVPMRRSNGYRSYAAADVRRLQLILLLRECGLELAEIAQVLGERGGDEGRVLEEQLQRLRARRRQIDQLICTVERTLEAQRKGADMADYARFEGFKRKVVADNEQTYGREARRRHGDTAVDAANAALLAMDETTWNDMNALEEKIKELLAAAMQAGDVEGQTAAELVRAHARWLQLHWGEGAYSAEAHRGLADSYLADDRFVAYYDGACGPGATTFLRDAIHALA